MTKARIDKLEAFINARSEYVKAAETLVVEIAQKQKMRAHIMEKIRLLDVNFEKREEA